MMEEGQLWPYGICRSNLEEYEVGDSAMGAPALERLLSGFKALKAFYY